MNMNWDALLEEAEKSGSFEPIPTGWYPITVEKCVAKTGPKAEYLALTCRVQGGVYHNRMLFGNVALPPDKPFFFFKNMKAFGFDPEFFKNNPGVGMADLATALVGRTALGEVTHREWNGETRDGLNNYKPLEAVAAPTPTLTPTTTATTTTAPNRPF